MYKRIVSFILLLMISIFLTSCTEKKNIDFLPQDCQTYNNFMYLVSNDLYQILEENDVNISPNHFLDSISKVKSLKIKEISLNKEFDLNGIQCFTYLNY